MKTLYWLNNILNTPKAKHQKVDNSLSIINSLHPDRCSSSLRKNKITKSTYDLQIIIPVYNSGTFLKECLDSILNCPTKYTYHIIVVNDGSTDNSSDILKSYLDDDRITIINQENRGFSGARNRALENIFGKYITFIDSDDILAPYAVTKWLNVAFKYDADIVEGSFQRRTENGELFGGVKWGKECITDISKMQGVAWLKVYKAELWQNLCFPEGYWYEDTMICGLIQPLVKRYVQIPDYVYYYTVNKSSISFNSRGFVKSLDNLYITKSVLRDADKLGLISKKYKHYYNFLINQIHTNWDRTFLLGADCEYRVFREHCFLFKKYFPKDIESKIKSKRLIDSLRKEDFKSLVSLKKC